MGYGWFWKQWVEVIVVSDSFEYACRNLNRNIASNLGKIMYTTLYYIVQFQEMAVCVFLCKRECVGVWIFVVCGFCGFLI